MSLFGSLSGGVSGLLAQSEAISVISDNLANVNTIGYKNTRTLFDQQVTSAGLSGTLYNSGGVGTSFNRFQNAQGAFLSTQSSTDLALSGSGFFVVVDSNEVNNDTGFFYTRAGAFSENSLGFLTTADGQNLLGWRTESNGSIQNVQDPQPIELQSVGSSARATAEVDLGLNINAEAELESFDTTLSHAANIAAILADPGDSTTGAEFVTDIRFYDSEGSARDVSLAFVKTGNNAWDYFLYTDGAEVTTDLFGNAVADGTNAIIGQGELRFGPNGSLKTVKNVTDGTTVPATASYTDQSMTINWSGGVQRGQVAVNWGDYTGGNVFDEPAVASGLEFTDGIVDIGFDEDPANTELPATIPGTYSFANLGLVSGSTYRLQVQEPDGSVFTVDVPTGNSQPQVAEFRNGISLSLSAAWDPTSWVGGTATIGATAIPRFDQGGGTNGVIQFASPNNTLFANQDGFGSGTLAAVSVDDEGFVIGSFTNGEAKKLWKVVVAVFQDPAALEPVGDNLLRETDASGRPLLKQAGVGGTATIVSGSLEQSTVDIAQEFSNMIVSQRAFQASSTIISTVDQMLNELLQLR